MLVVGHVTQHWAQSPEADAGRVSGIRSLLHVGAEFLARKGGITG